MNEEEKRHIFNYLSQDMHLDGRKSQEFRPVKVEYGISKTAEGSAKVTIGETVVIAGVKLEEGKPFPDTPEDGALMVNVELLPMASPEFELGPPGIKAIEYARVIDRGIRESKVIDTKKLCIAKGEKVWIVSVDMVPLNDAGNLFDAFALAAVAAIKDTKIPKIEEDGSINYKEKTDKGIPVTKSLPISVTVLKIEDKFVVDPLNEEEVCSEKRLTVAITEDGKICAMQKGGDATLTLEEIEEMVDIASKTSKSLRKAL